jgi:hypothetical protein
MGSNDCSVCQSPAVSTVNAELLKPAHERMTLREIEKISGLSRSALGRHNLRCIPRLRLALNRERKANASGTPGREIISWPECDGAAAYFSYGNRILHEHDLLPSDVIFAVEYGPPSPAASRDELNRTRVSDTFIAEAEAEDAERDKPRKAPN